MMGTTPKGMMAVKSRPHIVYLSFDGLLEPLGYSQVARVVMELAQKGRCRFTICSLEKPADRKPSGREEALEQRLRQRHVRWRRQGWSDGGNALDVARNVRAMSAMLADVIRDDGVDLVHARSYVAASVARRLGRRHGVPYLFDTRGFWVDERLERGEWFDGPLRKEAARRWERGLYADAAGAVMLTHVAADELRNQRLGPWPAHRPLSVIPTCVDYGEFGLGGLSSAGEDSAVFEEVIRAPLVVGYVGAVNSAYRLEASLRLFDHVLARRPDAHLLCLTRNSPALRSRLKEYRFPPSNVTVTSVPHEQMPAWLAHIDWGLLLRDEALDERAYLAAMPTKLAEYFACGVRPVYWGLNREVRGWIEQAKSGLVLDRCDEAELRLSADRIASTPHCLHTLWGARWRTQSHFGLASGVDRYQEIYDELLSSEESRRLRVLFLTEGTTVPASRFRVQQLVPHLRKRGIECVVRPAYGDGYNRWASTPAGPVYKLACSLQRIPYALDGARFDVLFLQRPALPFSATAERLANWRNPNTIFDVDDAIFLGPQGTPNQRKKEIFDEIVDRCAHIICGNQSLADHTRHRTPTTVIPTVVDTDVYRPAPATSEDHRGVVIGWMGTAANFDSLKMVAPLLRRMAGQEGVSVHIVSNDQFEPLADVEGVEQSPWCAEREVERLQGFDIGIMPLLDNGITRGKCGFKAIQYMAVGIPVVASPVGVNTELLGEEKAGLLARGPKQFEAALKRLVADESLRATMGRIGWRRVQQNYSVQAVIDRYVELLEAVARQRPDSPAPPLRAVNA